MIFALLLYYLLNPVVNFLSKKGVPRTLGIVLTYVVIFGMLFFGGARLIPVIQNQAQELIKQFPSYVDDFQKSIRNILDATPFATSSDQALDSLDKLAKEALTYLGNNWQDGAKGLGTIFSAVSSTAITLFTGPIIAFFLLQSPHKLYNAVIELIPPRFRKRFERLDPNSQSTIRRLLKRTSHRFLAARLDLLDRLPAVRAGICDSHCTGRRDFEYHPIYRIIFGLLTRNVHCLSGFESDGGKIRDRLVCCSAASRGFGCTAGHGRQIEDSSNHDSSRIIGNGGSIRISRCNLRYPDLLHDQIVRRLHLSQVQAAL